MPPRKAAGASTSSGNGSRPAAKTAILKSLENMAFDDMSHEEGDISDAAYAPAVKAKAKKAVASKSKTKDIAEFMINGAEDKQSLENITTATKTAKNVISSSPPQSPNGSVPAKHSNDAAENPTNSKRKKKSATEVYQKLSQLEHVLKRPDTYIGSIQADTQPLWVFNKHTKKMENRPTTFVPGLYKIFDEILVNAADHKTNDANMNTLKVTIDREQNEISVWNNGRGIPIEMHSKENCYIPELIFGNLLTSSNYDDDEQKLTGGRNGYGAKLANIYSHEFTVETADKNAGKKYKQTWSDNMAKKGQPKISACSTEYTKITFKPDLARFGMPDGITEDMEALMIKRVYDMAGVLDGVKVILNEERIPIRGFKSYVEMYVSSMEKEEGATEPIKAEYFSDTVSGRWEIAFVPSEGQFQQVSFCNAIATIKGGTHVNHVVDQISNALVETIKKKNKAAPVKAFQIKNHMWIFVKAMIVNPAFDSQTKEALTLRPSAFGSKCNIPDAFIKKISNSGIITNILHWAQHKAELAMKKTDGTARRQRVTGIDKLEDANFAGGRTGKDCTLILTEGDSAKTLAVSGIAAVSGGRNYYGVFPLRGKLLNVRDASHTQIMDNAEIQALRQILGLVHGKKYTSVDQLRYGSIMIMTDQDLDGSHIKGLLINFFDAHYPSLLTLPGFLLEFITPIIKVYKGGNINRPHKVISFFTLPQYEEWKRQNTERGWELKYYKGLGTSSTEEVQDYFTNLDIHLLQFKETQDGDRELIDMAFNKKRADHRKEWLRQFEPGTFLDHTIKEVPISDFINKELILFSMADNMRSIPSAIDGLKPSQRKVVFGCFKKNLTKQIKVVSLAANVLESTHYLHGEASLQQTITALAQDFTGSNNINLLHPQGQFGSRIEGGSDAAACRYIYTFLSPITRSIYHPDDDNILKYLDHDGSRIEPQWYIPVLPMILINGADGIGTGWSTAVPCYNPADVVRNIRHIMAGEPQEPLNLWYRGFKGRFEKLPDGKYKVHGIIEKIGENMVEILELPIRKWTNAYKRMLEEWLTGTEKVPAVLKDFTMHHGPDSVHFKVEMTAAGMKAAEAQGLENYFKLTSNISTSNMMLFDSDGRIKKFSSAEEVIEDFYPIRIKYYQMRKVKKAGTRLERFFDVVQDYLAGKLAFELDKLSNQARFIQLIIDEQLRISRRKKHDIVSELRSLNFTAIRGNAENSAKKGDDAGDDLVAVAGQNVDADSDNDEPAAEGMTDYDYLLKMPIWSLTEEKLKKLLKQCDSKQMDLDTLLRLAPIDIWKQDLSKFLQEWEAMVSDHTARHAGKKSTGGSGPKKGNPKKAGANLKASKTKVKKPSLSDDEDDDLDFGSPPKKKPVSSKSTPPSARKKPRLPEGLRPDRMVKKESVITASGNLAKSTSAKIKSLLEEGSGDTFSAAAEDVKPRNLISKPSKAVASRQVESKAKLGKPKPKKLLESSDEESDADFDSGAMAATRRAPRQATAKKPQYVDIDLDSD